MGGGSEEDRALAHGAGYRGAIRSTIVRIGPTCSSLNFRSRRSQKSPHTCAIRTVSASDHRVDMRDVSRVETDVTERHTFAGISWDQTYVTVTYRPPLGGEQHYTLACTATRRTSLRQAPRFRIGFSASSYRPGERACGKT
eukprot:2734359-Prymnesium_polylepis.3